jgi:hypothetical protein
MLERGGAERSGRIELMQARIGKEHKRRDDCGAQKRDQEHHGQ